MDETKKIAFEGKIESIQPRTTVWRYILSNRTVRAIGHNIFLNGEADGEEKKFWIALTVKQMEKLDLRIEDQLKGNARTKQYPKREFSDYYRASALRVLEKIPNG